MLSADHSLKGFLFSFNGRIGRQDFWKFFGPVIVLFAIVDAISWGVGLENYLSLLFAAVVFWPFFAVSVKRWHDRGKSGWWSFVVLVPLIGVFWWWIECGFLAGTAGSNRFGPDPSTGEAEPVLE